MKSLGHKLFYAILFVSVLMVNPPIVFWVNDYCTAHPLDFRLANYVFMVGILVPGHDCQLCRGSMET